MRYREPFTLYLRKLPSGKKIWYYQTYDDNNKRTSGFSTGKKSKTAAKAYCFDLLKSDSLIPERIKNVVFKDFANNWWVWDKCEYLRFSRKRKNMTESYADNARSVLNHQILPYFGDKYIGEISSYHIEKWLDSFAERGLTNASASHSLAILKVMFNEACRRGVITSNPTLTIKPLKKDTMPRGFLTQKEVNKLFDFNNKDKIWIDDISYYANMLSACTGMRISEIVAVRGDCLEKNTIRVDRQYKYKFGLTETKTHDVREVVIPKQLMSKLKELCEINRGGYIFSLTCGEKPVGSCKIRNSLNKALKQIGIGDEERNGRRISFHSWRHYFNTTMRSNNIMDGKLRAMVGHSSAEMTEHYTHFNASDFKDIQKVQNKIINFEKVV